MIRCLQSGLSVSYTHLDVYKRQALTIPDDVQEQFVKRTDSLAGYFQTIHPVRPHQHHITLAFLGALSKADVYKRQSIVL